ncbi:MAG: isochorismatase family protein [Opitutales bacterium]|nr:isochorismatase family protein [Opitutales bacterium]MDG1326652.1 isochorismatase family protein [Opitutales bacterium]
MKIEERKKTANLNPHNVAVFIIDVQETLLNGIKNKDQLIDSLNILIQSTTIFNLPLIITEQVPNKLGNTSSSLHQTDDIKIPKSSFSIFGCEEIKKYISEHGISHLVLSGIETPICIYLSAIDALKAGVEVTILSDCVGARRLDDQSVVFHKLRDAGCHILPLESFIYSFMGSANHTNFREINDLIRNR